MVGLFLYLHYGGQEKKTNGLLYWNRSLYRNNPWHRI